MASVFQVCAGCGSLWVAVERAGVCRPSSCKVLRIERGVHTLAF